MIVVERSWWPLVVVGQIPDQSIAPVETTVDDETCLEWGEDLRVALVVAGTGKAAARAQRDMMDWLGRFETVLSLRTRRLAWVIEDDTFRAAIETWLAFSPRPLMDVPSATFRSIAAAIEWLADTAHGLTSQVSNLRSEASRARAFHRDLRLKT